jgi:predicted MFS family arabinose efflux permease
MGIRTATARLRGGGRGWVLLTIAAGWVFVLGGRFLVPAVLPQVTGTFAVGNTGGGIAVTVIWGAYALMQSPAGVLVDRVGERRLLTGSLVLSAVSVTVIGVAPAYLAFLGGCAAFGFATGLYGPGRGTALARTFPDDDGTAIGVTLAAGSVGSAVLPFLAGALVGSVSWRYVVAGLTPPLLVAAALAWRTIPEHDRERASSPPPADELVGDVLRAVRRRGVAVAVAAVTLMLFAFQGLSAFYVTYLARSMPQRRAAGLFALLFLGGAVAQLAGGAAADRYGERAVLTVTAAVGAVAVGAVPFVDGVWPLAALSVVLGTRLAIAPVSNAYVIAVLPDAVTGTAWGTLRTAFFLLGATGSTVVGAMADAELFDEAFLLLAVVTAVAAALYAFLPSRSAVGE